MCDCDVLTTHTKKIALIISHHLTVGVPELFVLYLNFKRKFCLLCDCLKFLYIFLFFCDIHVSKKWWRWNVWSKTLKGVINQEVWRVESDRIVSDRENGLICTVATWKWISWFIWDFHKKLWFEFRCHSMKKINFYVDCFGSLVIKNSWRIWTKWILNEIW